MHASLFQPLGVAFTGTLPNAGLSASSYLQGQVFARRLAAGSSVSSGGDVTGPSSATDGNLAVFNGITGKIIKDGGSLANAGHWEPLSNMNPASPELVFDGGTGDVVMVWIN